MLDFLYIAVSWVLLRWHDLFVLLGFSEKSGIGWTLSVVFLVITARLLLFRLFVKQVHYQRNMQRLQPKIQKIREKHKNDRAEMNRKMMEMQQQEGFNPLAGCLPMLLQIPVFLGLYHVLRHLANSASPLSGGGSLCDNHRSNSLLKLYTFSTDETCNAASAKLFGAPLASSFRDTDKVFKALGGMSPDFARWTVILPLLLVSAGATLATQLMVRANATVAPEGTAATIQKAMLWLIPVGVMASGLIFNFPLGVLLYWFTSNLWTLAQQGYIIRFHPPEEEPVAASAGAVGKSLAPKVGQRPVRMAKGNPVVADDNDEDGDAPASPPRDTPTRSATTATGAASEPGETPAGQAAHPSQEAALSSELRVGRFVERISSERHRGRDRSRRHRAADR